METKKGALFVCLCIGFALLAITGTLWAADKELENEKIAVKFEREVERGGYKVVTTQELKGWLDQKKDMLILDTMPPADSFRKQHIPGAVNFEIQRPELTQMSDKMQARLRKATWTQQRSDNRLLLWIYRLRAESQRSHVGDEVRLQERLPAAWRHKGLGLKQVTR